MIFLKNVCGMVTLQIGAVSFASSFITLAICIFLVNVWSPDTENLQAWNIMFLFIFVLAIIWIIVFIGSYKDLSDVICVASVVWTVYIVLWIVFLVLSCSLQNKNTYCIECKCPDTLWLINSTWYKNDNVKPTENIIHDELLRLLSYKNNIGAHSNLQNLTQNENATGNENKLVTTIIAEPINSKYYKSLLMAIIVSVAYASALFYSWLILFSYQHEMQYKNNNCHRTP